MEIPIKKKEDMSKSCSLCPEQKIIYERCFNKWFSTKFLKGIAKEMECEEELKEYRKCLRKFLSVDKKLEEQVFNKELFKYYF